MCLSVSPEFNLHLTTNVCYGSIWWKILVFIWKLNYWQSPLSKKSPFILENVLSLGSAAMHSSFNWGFILSRGKQTNNKCIHCNHSQCGHVRDSNVILFGHRTVHSALSQTISIVKWRRLINITIQISDGHLPVIRMFSGFKCPIKWLLY